MTQAEADKIADARREKLQKEFEAIKETGYESDKQTLSGLWNGYYGGKERTDDDSDTGVDRALLESTIAKTATVPDNFNVHRKLVRLLEQRVQSSTGERDIDWATAELAAMGTLSVQGHAVRLSGQDCGRGTFSQRHAVLHDTATNELYTPLQHLHPNQASVDVINSPLSEAGVLGFDYGYSLDAPDSLIIWEAQFGDFFNAAQVIVDQFICSAEDKWHRLSGLTMLLPHGFEGAGPEHCSARLERFLTSAAEDNCQIAIPTSSSQYFHLLRRQVVRKWRKPLIVFTPKSLLREPFVASPIEEFTQGRFERVLPDNGVPGDATPARVLLTAGKIGVDLLKARTKDERDDFAVIRVEQLYPLPAKEIEACLSQYPSGTPIYWVQEEPRNMGAWYFMKVKWDEYGLEDKWPLKVVCRPESASPSTGSKKTHIMEQAELMAEAMGVTSNASV